MEIQTKFDQKENLELIGMFERLRVTDVRDGMDWMGYHHYGSVHHSFRPLFRPKKNSAIIGIARTARYVPYEGPVPMLVGDAYTPWAKMYYKEICYDPWHKDLEQGDFMCIDIAGVDVGLMGSNNTLGAKKKGVVGFLLNGGGIRDTDEVVLEDLNVWSGHISHGMDQARIRYIEGNIPIGIGGVAIYPGDVVVADGDGVIIVPRKVAKDVSKYAWQEASGDKVSRKKLYVDMGMKLDETVE
jgi:regulator of RNase E activity RraA